MDHLDITKNSMNPILTRGDLLYLAGLFDGEGSAGVYKHNISLNAYPQIALGMTDKEPVQFIAFCLGGNIYSKDKARNPKYKKYYVWKVGCQKAYSAAKQLLPYVKNPAKIRQLTTVVNHYEKE